LADTFETDRRVFAALGIDFTVLGAGTLVDLSVAIVVQLVRSISFLIGRAGDGIAYARAIVSTDVHPRLSAGAYTQGTAIADFVEGLIDLRVAVIVDSITPLREDVLGHRADAGLAHASSREVDGGRRGVGDGGIRGTQGQ